MLEFKHFQGPLMLNSKTFKHQIRFQGLSRALKSGKNFSRAFKDFQERVGILEGEVRGRVGRIKRIKQQASSASASSEQTDRARLSRRC